MSERTATLTEAQARLPEAIAEFQRGNKAAWPMWRDVVDAFGEATAAGIQLDVLLDWFRAALDRERIAHVEQTRPLPVERSARLAAAFDCVGLAERHRTTSAAQLLEQLLFLDDAAREVVPSFAAAAGAETRASSPTVLKHPHVVLRALRLVAPGSR